MFEFTDPLEQLNEPNALNKYKAAGLIATKAINEAVKSLHPNTKLLDLANQTTKFIMDECTKTYKDVTYKGLAFPVCISKNHIAGHYIPKENEVANNGDLIKIELGVHIDGYPALIAFTTLITENNQKYNDQRAKTLKAVIESSKEIVGMMKPGKTNKDVVKIMEKYAEKYNCNLPVYNDNEFDVIPGLMSYEISRGIIDGYNDDDDEYVHRFILSRNNPNYDFALRETEFEENEVYAVDILMSSGTGRLQNMNETYIYKRVHSIFESLKLKASRDVVSSFGKELFPVKIDPNNVRMKLGLKECIEKDLLTVYPTTCEKEGEFVARIKFTVIVKDKPILVCGKPADSELGKLE